MRALFVCGGSVGHLAPALAVWKSLRGLEPTATAHFVCADREDEIDVLRRQQVPFTTLPVPRRALSMPVTFVHDFFAAWSLVRTQRPDVVLSKGGSLSVPVCLAAWLQGVPIVLHESDAVMGFANRIVARIAKNVCVGLMSDDAPRRFIRTGNPIRPDVTQGNKEEGLRITGLTGARPILLVMGGSQGAQVLNEWVMRVLPELLTHCDVIHLTGRHKQGAVAQTGYWCTDYAHDELKHLYKCADLAVSRAGAGAIGELAANAIPTILVPLPHLAHDHQSKNALAAAAKGGSEVVQQHDMNDHLILAVVALLADRAKRAHMSERMFALHQPSASRQIAECMSACVAQHTARE